MSAPGKPELFLGLISGTSVDSIDAALVDLSTDTPRLMASCSTAWPAPVREAIFATRQLADDELDDLSELDLQCAEVFAEAAERCLQLTGTAAEDVIAIGSHGQTIRHRPEIERPFSLQIGDAMRITELTGIDVISDFRSADISAGGEGAPLVPAFHEAVFRHEQLNRVIVNIGGIANITWLPATTDADIIGFDTGPGNNMMDAWCERHLNESYDDNGSFAASGKTDVSLLAACMMEEYFSQAPPKSTGFELFNMEWLQSRLQKDMASEDVQSTLCDLTATSIIRDINRYATACDEIYICGGGVHNSELMRRLQAMTPCPVRSTAELGVDPDWVEAMTFAWLAQQHIRNRPGNIPSVTGANSAQILGKLTRA